MTPNSLSRSIVSAWLIAAAVLLPAAGSYTQAADAPLQLAPEVHADVLQNQIAGAVKANDPAGTLSYIDEYKALGVAFPTALLFVEAQAAQKTGDAARALTALTGFMNGADRKSAQYKEAVTLYPAYAAAAGAQKHVSPKPDEEAAKLAAATNAKMQADADAKAAQARAVEDRPTQIAKFLTEIKSELVAISGGKLQMGSYQETLKASKPVHPVEVNAFRVASAALTCQQYKTYATLSGATSPGVGCDQVPKISWNQGQQLLGWLNQQSPLKFRLLSEAEWEWLAANRKGPAKVSVGSGKTLAQRPGAGFEVQFSTSVAQPEWLADCQHLNYKGAPSTGAAWIDGGDCTRRVLRGASIVRRIEHRQLGWAAENLNFYTYDDAAFVQGRAFGAADQTCGGMEQCSLRVAADE